MSSYDVPVLIVGGGPTGLTAALLLARQNVPVLLIERRAGTSIHPRARGLNVRTMEIYRGLGLEKPIRAAGAALAGSRYMLFVDTLAGEEIRRVPDDELLPMGDRLAAITPCTWTQCAQDELEPLLVAAAREHGADIQFGTELIALTQDDNGTTATVMDRATGAQRTIHGHYLIAADGASSPIRTLLGIPMSEHVGSGRGPLGHYINIYFRADLRDLVHDRLFGICFVENPASPGLFLAVNNSDRWLFNVEYAPERGESPDDFITERCIELVRRAVGVPSLAVEIMSVLPWEAAARTADCFAAGRVFLAGDAAHVMPPSGGFGMNTGIQDAHNLAWKLAMVLAKAADATLLATYDAERRPVANQTVAQAVGELEAPTPDTGGGGWPGEDAVPSDAVGSPPDFLGPVLGYHYTSDAILASAQSLPSDDGLDLHGRPGTRAPHVWLERRGQRLSTLDLFDKHFVLLAGSEGRAWCEAAPAVATRFNITLDAYCVGADGELVDPNADWCGAYDVEATGAVLVRPDGFVAWRSRGGAVAPSDGLAEVMGQLLGRAVAPAPVSPHEFGA